MLAKEISVVPGQETPTDDIETMEYEKLIHSPQRRKRTEDPRLI